jgi:hypothetical protein
MTRSSSSPEPRRKPSAEQSSARLGWVCVARHGYAPQPEAFATPSERVVERVVRPGKGPSPCLMTPHPERASNYTGITSGTARMSARSGSRASASVATSARIVTRCPPLASWLCKCARACLPPRMRRPPWLRAPASVPMGLPPCVYTIRIVLVYSQNIKDRYYGTNDPVANKMLRRAEEMPMLNPPVRPCAARTLHAVPAILTVLCGTLRYPYISVWCYAVLSTTRRPSCSTLACGLCTWRECRSGPSDARLDATRPDSAAGGYGHHHAVRGRHHRRDRRGGPPGPVLRVRPTLRRAARGMHMQPTTKPRARS